MNLENILYLILLVVVELLTVTSIKYWSINKKTVYLALGIIGYILVSIIFAIISVKNPDITIINGLWQMFNIIFVSIIGIVLYKEKLSTVHYIGIIFAVISSVLLLF